MTTDVQQSFMNACLVVYPEFAPSKLSSLWLYSSIRRYWSRQPALEGVNPCQTLNDDKQAHRIAYFALLKGFKPHETLAVVGAWFFHHGRDLSVEEVDQLATMILIKTRYGKGSKRIREAHQVRQHKNRVKVTTWRHRKREQAGVKVRLSRKLVYDALPFTQSGLGDDLDSFTCNQSGRIEDLMTRLGGSRESLRCHLRRLEAAGVVGRNQQDEYFRFN